MRSWEWEIFLECLRFCDDAMILYDVDEETEQVEGLQFDVVASLVRQKAQKLETWTTNTKIHFHHFFQVIVNLPKNKLAPLERHKTTEWKNEIFYLIWGNTSKHNEKKSHWRRLPCKLRFRNFWRREKIQIQFRPGQDINNWEEMKIFRAILRSKTSSEKRNEKNWKSSSMK